MAGSLPVDRGDSAGMEARAVLAMGARATAVAATSVSSASSTSRPGMVCMLRVVRLRRDVLGVMAMGLESGRILSGRVIRRMKR